MPRQSQGKAKAGHSIVPTCVHAISENGNVAHLVAKFWPEALVHAVQMND